MLRNVARPLSLTLKPVQLQAPPLYRALASRRAGGEASEEDIRAARRWLEKFDPETIPKNICELSFSRSSGPGGQNVNKYV